MLMLHCVGRSQETMETDFYEPLSKPGRQPGPYMGVLPGHAPIGLNHCGGVGPVDDVINQSNNFQHWKVNFVFIFFSLR